MAVGNRAATGFGTQPYPAPDAPNHRHEQAYCTENDRGHHSGNCAYHKGNQGDRNQKRDSYLCIHWHTEQLDLYRYSKLNEYNY